ncbi:MAG: hypothetical protein U0V45_05140 [Flavobacteriales bacterium]
MAVLYRGATNYIPIGGSGGLHGAISTVRDQPEERHQRYTGVRWQLVNDEVVVQWLQMWHARRVVPNGSAFKPG